MLWMRLILVDCVYSSYVLGRHAVFTDDILNYGYIADVSSSVDDMVF